jgi:hypothetical protein
MSKLMRPVPASARARRRARPPSPRA